MERLYSTYCIVNILTKAKRLSWSYLMPFVVLFLGLSIQARSQVSEQDKIVLKNGVSQYEVREVCGVLQDNTGAMKPEELLKAPKSKFRKFKEFPTNTNNIDATYWLRFTVTNQTSTKGAHIVEGFDPKVAQITLYYMENGKLTEIQAGSKFPFKHKEYQHKNNHFTLKLDQGETRTYLVKFKSYRRIGFRLVIRENKKFINYALKEYIVIGLIIGLILMIVIVNTTLYVNIRDRTYLYYIFYVLSNLLFILSVNGIGYQYLWPSLPGFNKYATPVFLVFLNIFLYFYIMSFVQVDRIPQRIKRVFQYAVGLKLLLALIGLIFYRPLFYDIRVDLIPLTAAFWVCYKAYRFEKSSYRHLLIGFYCLFAGFIVNTLLLSGYLSVILVQPIRVFIVYSLDIGIILEVTFFSIAISKRISILNLKNQQKDQELIQVLTEKEALATKVNRELEEKVQERTAELNSKNKELLILNEQLKKATEIANRYNIQLDLQVRDLKNEIRESTRSNILLSDHEISFEDFKSVFPSDYKCLENLEEIKWQDGYSCQKCGTEKYVQDEMKLKITRRCASCGYDESVTVNTLFHRIRFPMRKAFYMLYLISKREGKIKIDELEELVQLRRATCWNFKKKVEAAIEVVKKKNKGRVTWEDLVMVNPKKLKI